MKATEARLVSKVSLYGGPEIPLHLTVKMRTGYHWRTQGLKGVSDLKSTLTSDMKMKNFEFALLVFSLALFKYLLTILSSFFFAMDQKQNKTSPLQIIIKTQTYGIKKEY